MNHEVWKHVLAEIERLPGDLSDNEVKVAQEGLLRGLRMDSDSPMARCAMDVTEVLDHSRRFNLGAVRAELEAVTIDDVRGLAESILRLDRMAAALCGPKGAELPG